LNHEFGSELANELGRKAVAGYYSFELEQLTLARVYLAEGKPEGALKILGIVSNSAEQLERTGVMIEVLMLEALAYKALGNLDKAIEDIKLSLSLAEPEGYISLFIEEGIQMANLLFEASRQGIDLKYTQRLLKAFPRLVSERFLTINHPR